MRIAAMGQDRKSTRTTEMVRPGPTYERFTDPTSHPLTADLVKRLEAAEAQISSLSARLKVVEDRKAEVRPRPDADLGKLSSQFSAQVVDTGGSFAALPESLVGMDSILHHPKRLGMKLYAVSSIHEGLPLHIVFHGAMVNGTWFPRFERVRSMMSDQLSFCSIADPSIQMDLGLKLAWYAGHDGVDPMEWIVDLVTRLVEIARPSQLVFVGSSGGGFASLRASQKFPGSLAFVTDPQTIVTNYHEPQVSRLLQVGFDGFDSKAALETYGERLSAPFNYEVGGVSNYVYYAQHRWDKFHIENHLKPFASVFGVSEVDRDVDSERFKLVLFDKGKHGPLSPDQFNEHLALAEEWHREKLISR